MSIDDVKRAATAAGRANAVKDGRPPMPWKQADLDASNAELHRLCRLHKINPYALPAKIG